MKEIYGQGREREQTKWEDISKVIQYRGGLTEHGAAKRVRGMGVGIGEQISLERGGRSGKGDEERHLEVNPRVNMHTERTWGYRWGDVEDGPGKKSSRETINGDHILFFPIKREEEENRRRPEEGKCMERR